MALVVLGPNPPLTVDMHGVAILKCAEVQEQRPTMCSVQQQSVVLLKQVGLLLMMMIAKQGLNGVQRCKLL